MPLPYPTRGRRSRVQRCLRFHSALADSTVAWSFYRRAVEYPAFCLLFEGRRGGTPVLKRGFAGPDDEERFRQLVAAHLPLTTGRRSVA